jgi:pilus assembly protein CpaB
MTPRRRAVLLFGLAAVLGILAASDVAGREAALRRRLGRPVAVVVAAADLRRGQPLVARRLAVRRVPARYAPAGAFSSASELVGLRAAVPIARGTDLTSALVTDGAGRAAAGAPVRPGERVAQIVALGDPGSVEAGGRVDVLVTRAARSGSGGTTTLALQDVEVLAAAPADSGVSSGGDDSEPRVAISLRVTLHQAVYLAAAQSFARELRVLPRAAGDERRVAAGMTVGSAL